MTYTLKIELGNDAMQLPGHVADALMLLASKLNKQSEFQGKRKGYDGDFSKIRDINGKTVGEWRVS